VSQLNQHQAADVEVIITSVPVQETSNRLKAELVRRFSISLEEYVRQLLSHDEMGEWEVWSPAQDVLDDFIRSILANRIQPHVQDIIGGQNEGSLVSTSNLADII
jgi:hypothetical protein